MPGPQLLDGGAHLTCGMIDDNDVSTGQVVPATCLRGPVDRDVAGLDGDACLCAVVEQLGSEE